MLQRLMQKLSRREDEAERAALLESMRATRSALNRAYDGFNRAADDELIEAYVYEINALQHRYAYLLRQARRLDASAAGKAG